MPRVCLALHAALAATFLAQWAVTPRAPLLRALAMIPAGAVADGVPKVWVWVSHVVVETDAASFVAGQIFLRVIGAAVEDAIGPSATAAIVAVAAVGASATAFFLGAAAFAIGGKGGAWVFEATCGFAPAAAGLAIAAVARLPRDAVVVPRVGLRVAHLPAVVVGVACAQWAWGDGGPSADVAAEGGEIFTAPTLPGAIAGGWAVWGYLRFFARREGGRAGEPRPFFALHRMVHPTALQSPVKFLADVSFAGMRRCGMGADIARAEVEAAWEERQAEEEGGGGSVALPEVRPLPGSTVADAERRRAAALNALSQRLTLMDAHNATDDVDFSLSRP